MPDIFISYAHQDQERVRPIVQELENHHWSVFWDKTIPPGKTWEDSIGKALEESPCVLVVWSHFSVQSDWVKEEADVAKKRDTLVPLFLDTVEPPMGFRRIHAADLSDWKNNNAHQGFQLLIDAIESKISPATQPFTDSRPVSKPDTVSLEGAAQTLQQSKPELQPVGSVSRAQNNRIAISFAVVMLVILGVVWGMNQSSSKVENKPVSPIAEPVKVNQEADARRKAEALRLTAEKDAATLREAEAAKAKQEADARRKEKARMKAEKEALARQKAEVARMKAENDAATRQIEEARRLKSEKEAIARREAALVKARQEAEPKKALKIGDEYSGGKIAWLDASGQHGLIAAKADLSGHSAGASEGRFTWEDAKAKCSALGDGWRLPSKSELNELYKAKSAVGGFSDFYYWSSTEIDANYAWNQYFYNGDQNSPSSRTTHGEFGLCGLFNHLSI